MRNIKTFEELREWVWSEKQDLSELLIDRLEELTEFQRGSYCGEINGYQIVLDELRCIIKYSDDCDEDIEHE
jgi:hypothetical protein